MNPLQKNKIDIASLSPDEQRLFRLYGKLPSKADHLARQLKERKYFDSGDYALNQAGQASSVDTGSVGSEHPLPENIPHLSSPGVSSAAQGGSGNGNIVPQSALHGNVVGLGQQSSSPVKESSFLNRETSADGAGELKGEGEQKDGESKQQTDGPISSPATQGGIPISS